MGTDPFSSPGESRRIAISLLGKEIPVRRANMIGRGDARSSAQNHLTGHKFAVVFAERTGERLVSWIAGIGAGRPFPAIAEKLLEATARRG